MGNVPCCDLNLFVITSVEFETVESCPYGTPNGYVTNSYPLGLQASTHCLGTVTSKKHRLREGASALYREPQVISTTSGPPNDSQGQLTPLRIRSRTLTNTQRRWCPQRSTLLSSRSTKRSGIDISLILSSVCHQHGGNQRVSTTESADGSRVRWSCLRYVKMRQVKGSRSTDSDNETGLILGIAVLTLLDRSVSDRTRRLDT